MKKAFYLFIFIFSTTSNIFAQVDCSGGRYHDSLYSVDVTQDVVYGHNYNYLNVYSTLRMDIYQPHGDVLAKRPLIIFAPGGAFVVEDKREPALVALCNKFASLGYVAVSIDYRVGVTITTAEKLSYALYRATHDMRAAVRYFRQDAATTNTYKIDTNIIVVGGTSAGALTALHVSSLDKISEILSAGIDTTGAGGVEGLSGNPGYSSKVDYVINLCGALGDSTFLEHGDVPIISMHGTNDDIVPYATGTALSVIEVDGSASINLRANHVGVLNPFYTFQGAGHVPFDSRVNLTNASAYIDTTFAFVRDHLYEWICGITTISAEYDNNVGVMIAPNPFIDNAEISTTLPLKDASLVIFDITGKEVAQYKNLNGDKITICKSGLVNGIYFYKLFEQDNKLLSVGKFVVQ